MSVANMTFMVDRLGADCAPGQYIRELTENGIAAVEALPTRSGEVIWDVDWNTHMLTSNYKLCIVDTGIGMTGPEMVDFINKLSSSMHEQSNTTNFGVGAKISAAPHNHAGIIYLSWKNGVGSTIHLWRDPATNVYGLRLFERPDGTFEYWAHVENVVKPEAIKEHGTMVVLLGQSEAQNTTEPPKGMPMPAKWILRYLNARYFRFPTGVSLKVREGHTLPRGDKHNFLRKVDGMEKVLQNISESHGSVQLTGARAHWWIVKPDADTNSGHFTPPGHAAALFQDELYDLSTNRAGTTRLQQFGVVFGHARVVLYIEPETTTQRVEANTARTALSLNGEPLPWAEWAAEFRDKMPSELRDLVEEVGAKSVSSDHKQAIRERLKQILDLFKIKRYRPNTRGSLTLDAESNAAGGAPKERGGKSAGSAGSGGSGGRGGSIYGLFLAAEGLAAEEVLVRGEPERKWTSIADGTRSPGDMEDRAAKYMTAQNLLLINGDFRVFTDMMERWKAKYEHAPGSAATVESVVREWFEQQLVETVVSAQALRESSQWTMSDLEDLWTEEALTAVVLPRWHINQSIGRALGAKLGSLSKIA